MNRHIKIGKPTPQWAELARRLYLDAFPAEERRDWSTILMQPSDTRRGPFLKCIGLEDVFAGMITTWHFDDFNYIEHLATDPAVRGAGVGSLVLSMLRQGFRTPWVIEVERPSDDNPMAARRIAFYQRNGFTLLDYDYIQPPYGPGLPEVPLLLMSTDPAIDPETAASTLRRKVYGAEQ